MSELWLCGYACTFLISISYLHLVCLSSTLLSQMPLIYQLSAFIYYGLEVLKSSSFRKYLSMVSMLMLPQNMFMSSFLESTNITLFGKKVFASVIKDFEKRRLT